MSKDLFKNTEFLKLIDWNNIISLINSFCTFDRNREYFLSCDAFLSPELIDLRLSQQDVLHSFSSSTSIFAQHIAKFGQSFSTAFADDLSKGRVLSLVQINYIALLMECDEHWSSFSSSDFEKVSSNIFFTSPLFNKNILQKLRSFVTIEGQLNEQGFLELTLLNQEIFNIESSARKKSSELFRSSNFTYSDSGEFDIINDRYVLPVSSDHYNSNYGPIIHRSRTGLTLFVEPFELKPYSQKRSELLAKKEWIVFKKCKELSELSAPLLPMLYHWSEFVFQFDILHSLMLWSKSYDLCRPRLASHKHIELKGVFHPLINDCIENDLALDESSHGLILSGPNTGGKTVFLKSVALNIALLRLGSWVPAKYASLYPYQQLFFFSHDLQDINKGLSSFSSEVENYTSLLEDLGEHSIVFIDEIFNSTSSEEASALAVSLLQYLSQTSSPHILLSTHHHGIKTTGTTMEDYISCHMAVTPSGDPLYKIIFGSPGSSRGIQTFKRITEAYSWSHIITEQAMELIGTNIFDYETALSDISDEKNLTERLNLELETRIKQLKSDKDAFELQKALIIEKEKNLLKDSYDQLVKDIEFELENFKQEKKSAKKVLSAVSEKRKFFNAPTQTIDMPANLAPLSGDLTGKRVWSKSIKKYGQVIKIRGDKINIDFNGLKSWIHRSDLLLDTQSTYPVRAISINYEKSSISSTSIDARGLRLELFQKIVLNALLELLNGDIPYLDIIHGHGEGILKKWIRNHLAGESELEWTPQDGNDGVTRVTLRR